MVSYSEDMLVPRPTPKLEDHRLLAVHDCLFTIFTDTLHIWGSSLLQPEDAQWGFISIFIEFYANICCIVILFGILSHSCTVQFYFS